MNNLELSYKKVKEEVLKFEKTLGNGLKEIEKMDQVSEKGSSLMNNLELSYKKVKEDTVIWARDHVLGLFTFNFILMFLILLHSAGYFAPFFPITINIIMFISLIMGIFLLGIGSRTVFFITLLFWLFAAILRILSIEVWAERTAVYAFEGLILGVVLQIYEDWKSS